MRVNLYCKILVPRGQLRDNEFIHSIQRNASPELSSVAEMDLFEQYSKAKMEALDEFYKKGPI